MDVSTGQSGSDGKSERIVLLGGGGHASDVLGLNEFINSRTPTVVARIAYLAGTPSVIQELQ